MEYKEHVELFWKNFENSYFIYEQFLAKKNYKYVKDELLKLTKNLVSVSDIEVLQNLDGTYDVLFCYKNKLDMYLNSYIVNSIVPNLFPRWNFYYARPPGLTSGKFLEEKLLFARVEIDPNNLVNLIVFCKQYIEFDRVSEIVKYYTGEIIFESVIKEIKVVDDMQDKSFFEISELLNVFLELQELAIIDYIESPFDIFEKFEVEPTEIEFIRDDIYQCSSVVDIPYQAFYDLNEDFFYEYSDVGVNFGFFFANVQDFEDHMSKSEDLLKKFLTILSNNQVALYLGTSFGSEFIYIDFIIFNKIECIDALTYHADSFFDYDIFFSTFDDISNITMITN